MSEIAEVFKGVRNMLKASSGLTNLVGSGNNARIYTNMVQTGVVRPNVVMYQAAGGYLNIIGQDLIDILITVEAWAESQPVADQCYGFIHTAIHRQTPSITGWACYWCRAENMITLPAELFEGKWLYRSGANFRIKAEKTS
jgi:hypothetical protein